MENYLPLFYIVEYLHTQYTSHSTFRYLPKRSLANVYQKTISSTVNDSTNLETTQMPMIEVSKNCNIIREISNINEDYRTKLHVAQVLCAVLSRSVTSDSLQPRGLHAAHQAPLSVGILQERILEWVAMPSSRWSSQPRDWTQVPPIAGGFFTDFFMREAYVTQRWIIQESYCDNDEWKKQLPEDTYIKIFFL